MRVNEAVVGTLAAHGIDTVFGIPGTQSLPLNEAIDARSDVRFVMARHETAVSQAAWGYGETSNRPAATCVIPGPGDLNAMNGLKNALNDGTPLVHIAVETEPDIRGGDGIHETPPDTYDNVVKENITVQTAESTVAELERGIAVAKAPPTGPVRIGIPRDFLASDVPLAAAGTFEGGAVSGVPEDAITEAADLLADSDAPVIVAGGGVRRAEATGILQRVAERLDAPVVPTYKGKGVFPEDHDLFAGILSVGSSVHLRDLIAESDAALGVGTDFDAVTTGAWSVKLPDALVHVALHPDDIGTGYDPAVGIVADAKGTLDALDAALADRSATKAISGIDRAETVRNGDADLMADAVSVTEPPITSPSAETALRETLPRDAIVTVDAGGFRIWSLHVVDAYDPHGFVDSGSWASMGVALPAAIGAKLANPDRPAVALTGEGGLMMCMHELHTAAKEQIPVIVFVLNNDDYATISWEAARNFAFESGAFDWPEAPVRFSQIAENLGVRGVVAKTPDDIRTAVSESLGRSHPTLIEVPTDPQEPQAKPLE